MEWAWKQFPVASDGKTAWTGERFPTTTRLGIQTVEAEFYGDDFFNEQPIIKVTQSDTMLDSDYLVESKF